MNIALYLSSRRLEIDTLIKQGVEIEEELDPSRVKERLGGSFAEGTLAALWFPLSKGGWLALPLPGDQEPCCGSDYHPWVYVPPFTLESPDSAPIYIVPSPLEAIRQIQSGRAAIALNRHWHAAIMKDGQRVLRKELQQIVFRRKIRLVSQADIGVRERQQLVQLYFLLIAATAEVEVCWVSANGEEQARGPFIQTLTKNAVDLSLVKEELSHTHFADYTLYVQTCRLVAQRIGVPTYELKELKPRPEIVQQELTALNPWPEEIDGQELLDQISIQLRSYIWMSAEQAVAVTLWIVASYLIDRLGLFSMLFITSPTLSCGKTRLCQVIARLVADPFVSVDVSAQRSIARLMRGHRP